MSLGRTMALAMLVMAVAWVLWPGSVADAPTEPSEHAEAQGDGLTFSG